MFRVLILSLGVGFIATGCIQKDKNLEAEDSRNPYFKKAETDLEARNYVEAVKDYESALRANPNVVAAHYELGRIYGDKLGDQISAMYHFHKFLELRPTSEKRENVQALLDSEKIAFAATLPNSPIQNAQAFAKLQSDNALLKRQLEEKSAAPTVTADAPPSATAPLTPNANNALDTGVAPAPTSAPAVNTASGPTTPAAAAPPETATTVAPPAATTTTTTSTTTTAAAPAREAKSYKIQSGDSLWKISSKFYPGDTKNGVEKIKQANAAALPDGKPLKIGTSIVIP